MIRKICLTIMLVVLISSYSYAADVWKVKIMDVGNPGLNKIEVEYVLTLNNENYITNWIFVDAESVDKLTLIQKENFIVNEIKKDAAQYIKVSRSSAGIKTQLLGKEYNVE